MKLPFHFVLTHRFALPVGRGSAAGFATTPLPSVGASPLPARLSVPPVQRLPEDFGETPATDNITFTLGGKQCALTISLYEPDGTMDILTVRMPENSSGILYDLNGRPVSEGKAAGIRVSGSKKILIRK